MKSTEIVAHAMEVIYKNLLIKTPFKKTGKNKYRQQFIDINGYTHVFVSVMRHPTDANEIYMTKEWVDQKYSQLMSEKKVPSCQCILCIQKNR